MWSYKGFDDLLEQIEYFADTVSGYIADFLLFPEYVNAPLMAEYHHLGEAEVIRKLAGYTTRLRDTFSELAVSYSFNIITGSMPEVVAAFKMWGIFVNETARLRNMRRSM